MRGFQNFLDNESQRELDNLLADICVELQLSPTRYRQAEERYQAVASILESSGSPLKPYRPRIYPQGSMRLGTTVKPIDGPHDLDFVCELTVSHENVNPMALLNAFYQHLRGHGTYKDMVELKNRCVRVVYANEFYMDILPACGDPLAGGTCIQVPDRAVKGWKPSNPIGYSQWFETRSAVVGPITLVKEAAPLPRPQDAEDKLPLQLAVQLIKRWRDLAYAGSDLAPISVVLTTLAAAVYRGESSVSEALTTILNGISDLIASAAAYGQRLVVRNPSNPQEDLSEQWDETREAHEAFTAGIEDFKRTWAHVTTANTNVSKTLEAVFGEPVKTAVLNRAQRLQGARRRNSLGVASAGLLGSVAGAIPVKSNTFYGEN
jgi:hypothetical protein